MPGAREPKTLNIESYESPSIDGLKLDEHLTKRQQRVRDVVSDEIRVAILEFSSARPERAKEMRAEGMARRT